MMRLPLMILGLSLLPGPGSAQAADPDTALLKQMVSVPDILEVRIVPDGRATAIVREEPDWQNNYYDNEIIVVDAAGELRLTQRSDGGSWRPRWQPQANGIAYLQYRTGSGTQILYQRSVGSDPIALTDFDTGISSYAWSPDGNRIAAVIQDAPAAAVEARSDQFGDFQVAGRENRFRHIWILDVAAILAKGRPATPASDSAETRRLTQGRAFTLGGFWESGNISFTPNGAEIVFDHSRDSSADAVDSQDISAVRVADGRIRAIVQRPGRDRNPIVSPDGYSVAFETSNGPYRYYGRDHLAVASIRTGAIELITDNFPESATLVAWSSGGVYFQASEGMDASLYLYDLQADRVLKIADGELDVAEADVSPEGVLAIAATTAESGPELYLGGSYGAFRKVTNTTAQFFDPSARPTVSIVRTTAPDGTISAGVLYLPHGARASDPPRPMLTIIHGGPKQTARPTRTHAYVYPVEYWLRRGAAVFMPNYRGSAGFGDAYRSASFQNYGQGPLDDILTAIDVLVEQGIAAPARLGVMGWSNGGYLTAFLISHDDRFAAASIGAGITDWTTQYSLSDDPNGSVQYLGGTPLDAPRRYRESSPISRLAMIQTPALIQHGSDDQRVPIANAQMLYRGLRSIGRRAEFVTFSGLAHYFSKPKARLAAAEQNRRWFGHYLFEDAPPDLALTDLRPPDTTRKHP